MRALDKKLLRDFAHLKGQALTIALVVAAGIGVFVGFQSVYGSLLYSRDVYYERYRFADVFASFITASSRLASGTASITRPQSFAVLPSMVSPVSSMRLAFSAPRR